MRTDYYVSSNKQDMDISVIHNFIADSYWAKGIPLKTMEKAIHNSLCFGVFNNEKRQVGFARTITDKATYAYLADVFILNSHRGLGLSKMLMEHILQHPDLQSLRRMGLVTADAHGLYEQFGFTPIARSERFMEKCTPDIYVKP